MHRNVRLLLGSSIFEALGAFLGGIAIVGIGFSWTFALMAFFAVCSAFLSLGICTKKSVSAL